MHFYCKHVTKHPIWLLLLVKCIVGLCGILVTASYRRAVHCFVIILFIYCFVIVFNNNKGPLFYTIFMALNGLCAPIAFKKSFIHSLPQSGIVSVSASTGKLPVLNGIVPVPA